MDAAAACGRLALMVIVGSMTAACTSTIGEAARPTTSASSASSAPSASSPTPAVVALPDASPTTGSMISEATSTVPDSTVVMSAPPTTAAPSPVRLVFTGDVLMHSPLWRQAERNGGGVHDFAPMFAHVQPLIESADLAVCHLETPVAPPFEAYSTSPRYGVPAEVVDGLAAVGFDHCSTASNHTFDRGVEGLVATVARFDAVGLTQHGMATEPAGIEPILLVVGGHVIGHVSAAYGYDEGDPPPDEPWRSNLIDSTRLIADAQLARSRGAEVVIASLHWGASSSHRASPAQRLIAEELAASGVIDLVVGHHAHVVQPIEQIGAMWVAYGLGNFISNMPIADSEFTSEGTRDGLVLEVELGADGVSPRLHVTSIVARPIWVDRDAGWVVRDVWSGRLEPELDARVGGDLDDSWRRTAAIVGPFLPVS